MTFPVEQKTMKKSVWQTLDSYLCIIKELEKDNGHLLVLVLKWIGTLSVKTVHKEYGTIWLKGCWWNWEKVIVQFTALRAHCAEVDSEAKDIVNCRYTIVPIWKRLRLLFEQLSLQTISVVTEQSRKCVKSMNPFTRERRDLLWWDNRVPHSCLQQYGERIEKLSQRDKLSKFCMDAGFLSVVEIGQYFMTKDTEEFSQFNTVACREYILPRDEEASQPKGWIWGNTNIGSVLEIATCCFHGK